jgi:hypothetical protein
MIVEAVLYEHAHKLPAGQLLPFVLSMPRQCPCGDVWMILLDEPRVLEVELGSMGQKHLELLEESMKKDCSGHQEADHLRTDGQKVWIAT